MELYLTYISQNLKILIKRQFHAIFQDVNFHSSLRKILDRNPRKPSDNLVLCRSSSLLSDKFNYENCETCL